MLRLVRTLLVGLGWLWLLRFPWSSAITLKYYAFFHGDGGCLDVADDFASGEYLDSGFGFEVPPDLSRHLDNSGSDFSLDLSGRAHQEGIVGNNTPAIIAVDNNGSGVLEVALKEEVRVQRR